MNRLSIKAKITIFICISLLTVFGVMAALNGRQQSKAIAQIYTDSSYELNWSLSQQIEQIMVHGENENLQPLTEEITSKKILQELVVVDANRVIKRSSDKSLLNRKAEDPIWGVVLGTRRDTIFETKQDGHPAQVSYHVFENKAACSQCHDAATQPVLGALKMVKSTEALTRAATTSYLEALILSILGVLLLVTGILIALNKTVFKPLQSVRSKLELAAEGDIQQTLEIRSNDEIGSLLRSIQNLIDYIRGIADVTGRVAEGDLTVQVTPRSERDVLSRSFKTMVQNLNRLVRQLADNARELVSATTQIASSSELMARGAKEQAEQVGQVSTAIEEMTATILDASRNVGEATSVAKGAADTATTGGRIVSETIQGIQKIAHVVQGASGAIRKLSESADRIGEIISVIDDIADQTNLLALNAAIEAARAGEQGRGFAVVADEVRKLAERTGRATSEITEMIKGIQKETTLAVNTMESGTAEVERGRELADRAGTSLNEIVTMAQRVTEMITQIATASEGQTSVAEQISQSIEHISSVTKETANGSEQSAAAAEELSRQADGLTEIVGRFKVQG
jgi:methyl-accepting chemotaxis protein